MYRKMLLSFFLISVITISVLVADFYSHTAADLKRQSVESMEQLTQQSAATLDAYLNNVRSFAWNYFGDADFQQFVLHMGSDPDALSTYTGKFSKFVTDNPILSSAVVSRLNGFTMRAGNSVTDAPPEERARLTDLAIASNGKGVWVPSVTYPIGSKQPVGTITFIQALRKITLTSPGAVIGVMMYDISYDSLQNWLQDVEGDRANRIYIVQASNGQIIHSLNPIERGKVLLNQADLDQIGKNSAGGHFYVTDKSGKSLVVYEQLKGTDWMLVSEAPLKALIKPVNDFTKRTAIFGLISLFVSLLLASLFSSRTITPLKELSKGMKAIEVGNYSVSLPVRSQDEVGYLSTSFNRMAKEINHLISKVYETELVKKNAEIKALQSQINPHFLYNTLGIIDSLSSIDGDSRVSYISRSLAKMFRYNISGQDVSTLDAEMQQIRLYLSIQKIRFDTRFDFSIYLEPGLESVLIPKLLFQPLVENSILHGISGSIQGGSVRVEAMKGEEETVQIRVWNNGVPIHATKQEWLRMLLEQITVNGELASDRSSIGLSNVQKRIQLLYGDNYGIEFESSEAYGTSFTLTINQTLPQGGNEA